MAFQGTMLWLELTEAHTDDEGELMPREKGPKVWVNIVKATKIAGPTDDEDSTLIAMPGGSEDVVVYETPDQIMAKLDEVLKNGGASR